MAFDDDERSVADSQPIELYEIVTTKGTYRRTSHNAAYTYAAQVYTPIPGMRSPLITAAEPTEGELVLTLPQSDLIVQDHAFAMPSRSMLITVYRVQRTSGGGIEYFKGKIVGIAVEGKVGKLRLVHEMSGALATKVCSVHVQRLCNHVLYDERCTVARASFDVATTVAAISADGMTLTLAGDGGNPDQWLKAGEIVRDSDQERRLILDHTGLDIVIDAPFQTLGVGNAVTVYAGCDHTLETCESKFSNVDQFGGHHWIPRANPFVVSVHAIPVSSTT